MLSASSEKVGLSAYIDDICDKLTLLPENSAVIDYLPIVNGNGLIAEKYSALVRGMRERARSPERGQMFHDLISYISVHFAAENSMMNLLSYPDAVNHAQQHSSFIKTVNRLCEDVKTELLSIDELILFIGHWLVGHVLLADTSFEEFYPEHQ